MNGTIPTLIVAFVNGILQLVIAFGVGISSQQNVAITGLVNTAMALAVALYHLREAEIKLKKATTPTAPSVVKTTPTQPPA